MDWDFEAWWKMYPKRSGGNPKVPALKAWNRLIKFKVLPEMGELMDRTRSFYSDCAGQRILNTPYIPHASTWLNQRRWEGYEPKPAPIVTSTAHPSVLPTGYEDAARALIAEIGGAAYTAWFGKVKWSNGGDVIRIQCASAFDKQRIEANYVTPLERLTGKQVEVMS